MIKNDIFKHFKNLTQEEKGINLNHLEERKNEDLTIYNIIECFREIIQDIKKRNENISITIILEEEDQLEADKEYRDNENTINVLNSILDKII